MPGWDKAYFLQCWLVFFPPHLPLTPGGKAVLQWELSSSADSHLFFPLTDSSSSSTTLALLFLLLPVFPLSCSLCVSGWCCCCEVIEVVSSRRRLLSHADWVGPGSAPLALCVRLVVDALISAISRYDLILLSSENMSYFAGYCFVFFLPRAHTPISLCVNAQQQHRSLCS